MMPPPTMTTRACAGTGSAGRSACDPTWMAGGTPPTEGLASSTGTEARSDISTGWSGGRGVKGSTAPALAPVRSASVLATADRQVFPWQSPVPKPVYRLMLSMSRYPLSMAWRTSSSVTSSQGQSTVLLTGGSSFRKSARHR